MISIDQTPPPISGPLSAKVGADHTHDVDTHSHRYFEDKYPLVGTLVVFRVESLQDLGFSVSLLDYAGIEAFISFDCFRLPARRNRTRSRHGDASASSFVPGTISVAFVREVDAIRGHVELGSPRSRLIVASERETLLRAHRERVYAHGVMCCISETNCSPICRLENLYLSFGWPLMRDLNESLYRCLRLLLHHDEQALRCLDARLPSSEHEALRRCIFDTVSRKMRCGQGHFVLHIVLRCTGPLGVRAIRSALAAAITAEPEEDQADSQAPIRATLVVAPRYALRVVCDCEEQTIKRVRSRLLSASRRAKESIQAVQGGFFGDDENRDSVGRVLLMKVVGNELPDMRFGLEGIMCQDEMVRGGEDEKLRGGMKKKKRKK